MKFHIHVLHVWYIHVHVLHVLMHTYGTCVPHVHVSVFCILQIKINNFFIFLHFYMYVISNNYIYDIFGTTLCTVY